MKKNLDEQRTAFDCLVQAINSPLPQNTADEIIATAKKFEAFVTGQDEDPNVV